jgi:stage II sporulation protein P
MPRWIVPRKAIQYFLIYQGIIIFVLFMTGLGLRMWSRPAAVSVMSGSWDKWVRVGAGEICGLWEMDLSVARSLLHQGIPLLKKRSRPQTVYGYQRGFFRAYTDLSSDVDLVSPLTILQRQILPFGRFRPPSNGDYHPIRQSPYIDEGEEKIEPPLFRDWGDSPLVGIYHTHTSESYLPDTGVERTKGTPGSVVKIGEELSRTLWRQYGIPVVHNRTIHDYPTWRLSYVNAGETAEEIVESYSNLQVVLDIHRDAGKSGVKLDNYTMCMGEEKISRVTMVVGSDKLGLPHPRWRENLAFARELNDIMEEIYPGISRGVRLREDGRWNQHVHPHAIIIEVGEVHSSEAEALATARFLARVIYEYLAKDK